MTHHKMMFVINFFIILELLVLDSFVDSADRRSLDEQETMNNYEYRENFKRQPQYQHENNQNNHFNEDLENLNQFNQEVEDANLEKINYEIQSQAAKLNQLNDESVYSQEEDQGTHEIIEQTDIAYERPMISKQRRQEHYAPNYERYNINNQDYEERYMERPRERYRERPKEMHRERPRERQQYYYTYQRSNPQNPQNEEQQQQDQTTDSQQEEPQNDSQSSQNSQENSQNDQQQQPEEPQQQAPEPEPEPQPTPQSNNLTLPDKTDEQLTNLPKNKFGIHNNIFVIQAACGKLKVKKGKDDRNVEKQIRKVKRRKTKRNERKRKQKRKKAKKIILIEEHNYVPAYKEHEENK